MAKKNSSIKAELQKIVRKKIEPSYLEKLGIAVDGRKEMSILQAIAFAQVKKGLEGELKSAMFIEEILNDKQAESAPAFDLVVKVLDEENGNKHNTASE